MKRLIFCLLFIPAGCHSFNVESYSDEALVDSLANAGLADRQRLLIMDELEKRRLSPGLQEQLGQTAAGILSSPRHSPEIRGRVLDILIDTHPDNAAVHIGDGLQQAYDPVLQQTLIAALTELQDERSLPVLIDWLAGNGNLDTETKRLCREALTVISGQTLHDLLADTFRSPGPARLRMAALHGLQSVGPTVAIPSLLAPGESDDPFLETLRFWHSRFGYLPGNVMSYFQCELILHRLNGTQVGELQQKHDHLEHRYGYRFNIADVYLLLHAGARRLDQDRDQLLRHIETALAGLGHTRRTSDYPGYPGDYSESFLDQADHLGITDLIRIQVLLETLRDPGVLARLSGYLRLDRDDRTSEIGGLCTLRDRRVVFTARRPGRRENDNTYIESIDTLREGAFVFARWHCHVDRLRGPEIAGPGRDDMLYARWINSAVVIITRLDEYTMNIDLLTAGGRVIDLGNYTQLDSELPAEPRLTVFCISGYVWRKRAFSIGASIIMFEPPKQGNHLSQLQTLGRYSKIEHSL